jgi:nitrite reductase/ring-hydroxylating ferredoxin subunit
MGHDVGLAMIYGPVLGAWLFPLAYASHSFLRSFWHRGEPLYVALGIALVVATIFTLELIRLDGSLPGQKTIRIGELDQFQSITGKLRLRFQSRNMSRTFNGKLSKACLDTMRSEICQTDKGRELKVRYKTKWKWNQRIKQWESHKEITEVVMPDFVKVAKTEDIRAGQAKMVEVNGKEVALFNVAGVFYAIDNTCTHVGGPLCEGEIVGNEVTCPWHRAVFDVTSGQVLGPPAASNVNSYNVRVEGSDIEVEV